MENITEKFMEKLQGTVNQNVLKKFQDTTNKLENTQKQLNKLREDFNKHQSETKETI
jgi:hypothetical protein